MDFREETERWLENYGYEIEQPVLVLNNIYFHPVDKYDNSPLIQVTEYNGIRKVYLYDGRYLQRDIKLTKGPIDYKHPKMLTYIEAFKHYNTLLEMYPF